MRSGQGWFKIVEAGSGFSLEPGFRFQGSGFRFQGLGFIFQGLGLRVCSLEFKVLRAWGLELRMGIPI